MENEDLKGEKSPANLLVTPPYTQANTPGNAIYFGTLMSFHRLLALYERNWKHVDRAALSAKEAALVEALSQALGAGRLLV